MSATSSSLGSRHGDHVGKNEATAASTVGGQNPKSRTLFRSRTDSVITYTPPSIGEAPGSTFYIRKNGQIDYLVLLKVSR